MMTIESEKLLIYFGDEEHIVRRLGAAVVSCWQELPEAVRTTLIERACRVLDELDAAQFEAQVKGFIATHSGQL
jgi:hypothetical protein